MTREEQEALGRQPAVERPPHLSQAVGNEPAVPMNHRLASMQEQLRAHAVVTEISRRLLMLPTSRTGTAIVEALSVVAGFLGFDGAAFVQRGEHSAAYVRTHCWPLPSAPRATTAATAEAPSSVPEVPADLTAWVVERLLEREVYVVADLLNCAEFVGAFGAKARGGVRALAWIGVRVGAELPAFIEFYGYRAMNVVDEAVLRTCAVVGPVLLAADRRAKDELALASERALRDLALGSAGLGTWRLSLDTQVIHLSPRWKELLGYGDHELSDQDDVCRHVHPDDVLPLRQAMEAYLRAPTGAFEHEVRLRHRQGRYIHVLSRARIIGSLLVGCDVDITQRKAYEESLRQGESLTRSIVDHAIDAILTLQEQADVASLNPSAERLFGVLAPEVIGRPIDELLEDFGCGGVLPEPGRYEVSARRRDGSTLPVEVTLSALPGPVDKHRVVAIVRDLSERKRLEAQYLHAQKMEALGRLAGGVAHDFNNLLTIVSGFSDLVLEELPEGSGPYAMVTDIRAAAGRAEALTRQLLAFSRKQVQKLEMLDIGVVVGDLERMLRRLIGEDIELKVAIAHGLPGVRADRGQLEQVLMNLVVNARDAMPHGGTLILEAFEATERCNDSDVRVVHLCVTDSGIGMDEATLARAFEPFFTTKGVGKGTGLGLATVHGIVSQSGGHIEVTSEVGRGTRFDLTFRAYVGSVAPAREVLRGTLGGRETILLVEDHDGVRSLARTVLQRRGYHVLEAASGREALRTAESHHGEIDLLITDLVMPRLSGSEVAAAIRALRPRLRVLFVSGYNDEVLEAHERLPKHALLRKPFAPGDLAAKVRELLDGRA